MALAALTSTAARAGGINVDAAIQSGDVTIFENRRAAEPRELSATQLQAILSWLTWHRRSWRGTDTRAASQPVLLLLDLKHSDGGLTTVNVIAAPDGGRYVLFVNHSARWSFESWGGLSKAPAAMRPISDREFELLKKILRSR